MNVGLVGGRFSLRGVTAGTTVRWRQVHAFRPLGEATRKTDGSEGSCCQDASCTAQCAPRPHLRRLRLCARCVDDAADVFHRLAGGGGGLLHGNAAILQEEGSPRAAGACMREHCEKASVWNDGCEGGKKSAPGSRLAPVREVQGCVAMPAHLELFGQVPQEPGVLQGRGRGVGMEAVTRLCVANLAATRLLVLRTAPVLPAHAGTCRMPHLSRAARTRVPAAWPPAPA